MRSNEKYAYVIKLDSCIFLPLSRFVSLSFSLALLLGNRYRWTWNTPGIDQLVYTCDHVYVLLVGCNGTANAKVFVVEEILDNHANRKWWPSDKISRHRLPARALLPIHEKFESFNLRFRSLSLLLLQQVQFLIVFVHTVQIQFQPTCNFPKSIGLLLTLNAGIFTYMFSSFYIKSYNRRPTKTVLNDVSNGCKKQALESPNIAEKTKEALNVAYKKSN